MAAPLRTPPPPQPCPPPWPPPWPPRTSVVSPLAATLAVAAAPGLISDSACARSLVAAERLKSAAAARPKNPKENPKEQRPPPRPTSVIFNMCEVPWLQTTDSEGRAAACPRYLFNE